MEEITAVEIKRPLFTRMSPTDAELIAQQPPVGLPDLHGLDIKHFASVVRDKHGNAPPKVFHNWKIKDPSGARRTLNSVEAVEAWARTQAVQNVELSPSVEPLDVVPPPPTGLQLPALSFRITSPPPKASKKRPAPSPLEQQPTHLGSRRAKTMQGEHHGFACL
jgi:hypothetical protein